MKTQYKMKARFWICYQQSLAFNLEQCEMISRKNHNVNHKSPFTLNESERKTVLVAPQYEQQVQIYLHLVKATRIFIFDLCRC